MSEETKEKLRKIRSGKKLSDETKEKLRIVNTGKKLSDETKEKIRQSNLGRSFSPEHLEKLRRANIGRIVSEETKEKYRQAKLGNTIWLGKTHSEETKEKIRISNLGKRGFKHSQSSIEKMRISKLGGIHSEQTKLKISKSKKGIKHNKLGANNEITIEYYRLLNDYLKDYGLTLNNKYLNLEFDGVGIFMGGILMGDISLRISRNIIHLRGLNFTGQHPKNLNLVDVVYNFHFDQSILKNWRVKIYTDIDNTIEVFKKVFKDFEISKRQTKVMANPRKFLSYNITTE